MPSTRETLVAAATELIDAGGAEAVTLREVGRRAGVSHNAPYKHFQHKEALLAAVAAEELNIYSGLLTLASGAAPALDEALQHYVERALAYPERFRLVYRRWNTESEELAQAAARATRVLDTLIAPAQQEGLLPAGPVEHQSDLLRAVAHGAIELTLTGHLGKRGEARTPDQLVSEYLRLMSTA
ncbi:TetR/AcrR family transcriptional regulator [Nesterenkonia ebinurensis]|uniref:TetR/AcrR family transcriptional regulator n=1 Tax=Nesterenkonia ebinurensis TaxID=2608252 RepID=UPI00168B514B|nr:TetR/AcrR family transcriptional regulator [Nesterenkonia ebinurensis]